MVQEADGEAVLEGFGLDIQILEEYVYTNDGLLVSMRVERFQKSFNVLTFFKNQVDLQKNLGKTASIDYQTCCYIVENSAEAYALRMM